MRIIPTILAGLIVATAAHAQPATQPAPAAPPYVRGFIGQNAPSYFKDGEPSRRAYIDRAKASRAPEPDATRVLWRIHTNGTAEDAGVYTLRIPRRVERVTVINNPSQVLSFVPGDTLTEAKIDLKAPAGQLTLVFPPGTDLAGAQVLAPGYDQPTTPESGPWTREYVAFLRRLNAGTIRAMDFLRTNGSAVRTWADVGKLTDDRYGDEGRGGPPEAMVDLANRVGADLWINIPHGADDDCVRQYANVIKNGLDPPRFVYLELSNEVWNTAFSIAKNTAFFKAAGVADPECDGANPTVKTRQAYAKRLTQVVAIFREVLGDRVRPVLAGQAAYPEQLEWSVDWIERKRGPLAGQVYGIAVAPYFGFDQTTAATAGLTADSFLAPGADGRSRLERAAETVLAGPKLQRFFFLAKTKSVQALAYEWSNDTSSKASPDLAAAVNSDPRVYPAIRRWADLWTASGGGTAMHFVALGNWTDETSLGAVRGLAEWSPKAQAIADASAAGAPRPTPPDPRVAQLEAERDALKADRARTRDALKALAEGLQ